MSTGAIKLQNDKNNHKIIIKVVHIILMLYYNSSKVEECEEQTEIQIFLHNFSLCSMA